MGNAPGSEGFSGVGVQLSCTRDAGDKLVVSCLFVGTVGGEILFRVELKGNHLELDKSPLFLVCSLSSCEVWSSCRLIEAQCLSIPLVVESIESQHEVSVSSLCFCFDHPLIQLKSFGPKPPLIWNLNSL